MMLHIPKTHRKASTIAPVANRFKRARGSSTFQASAMSWSYLVSAAPRIRMKKQIKTNVFRANQTMPGARTPPAAEERSVIKTEISVRPYTRPQRTCRT